jgi:hypothetical protein
VQPLPNPRLLPLDHPPVAGRAAAEAEFERQMPPRDSGVQYEQDPLQRLSIGQPPPTRIAKPPLDLGQQWFDPLPQLL